ncbi:hypothetical protein J6590_098959 [Homalodisca vitripennis]|nr:hypothetical protein J6590_098959 [Homalodisca vitripennis]
MTSDAGLTLIEELQKDMLECPGQFRVELQTRSKSLQDAASLFKIAYYSLPLPRPLHPLRPRTVSRYLVRCCSVLIASLH